MAKFNRWTTANKTRKSREQQLIKWPSAANEKPNIEGYLFKSCKMGNFNPWRTLLEPYLINAESLVPSLGHQLIMPQLAMHQHVHGLGTKWILCKE